MMPVKIMLSSLLLLAARLFLYLGIALLAMETLRVAVIGAFTFLHHLMVR